MCGPKPNPRLHDILLTPRSRLVTADTALPVAGPQTIFRSSTSLPSFERQLNTLTFHIVDLTIYSLQL